MYRYSGVVDNEVTLPLCVVMPPHDPSTTTTTKYSDHFLQGAAAEAGTFWARGARRAFGECERGCRGGRGAAAGHRELPRSGCAASCISNPEGKI